MSRSHVTYTRKASCAVVALPNAMQRIDRVLVYIVVVLFFVVIFVACLSLSVCPSLLLVAM